MSSASSERRSTARRREADHELGRVLSLLPAVELLLGVLALGGVADQEAVVGLHVHGLRLGGDAPFFVARAGGGGGGRAGGPGLVAPVDQALPTGGSEP